MKGADIYLFERRFQSKLQSLYHGWFLISEMPFQPNLLLGFLCIIFVNICVYLINKVYGGQRPPIGQIILRELNLLGEYIIPNFLPIPAIIGPPAHHHLKSNDAHRIVVHGIAMILPAHDLRRHIARRTRCICTIARLVESGDTQIGYPEVSFVVHHEVLGFDVAVQDAVFVQVLKPHEDAADVESGLAFPETTTAADVETQIASSEKVHHQIQALPVLKRLDHINQKRIFEGAEQSPLIGY
jgi:hypothetical protein